MERDIPIDPKLLDQEDELIAALVGTEDMDYDDDDFSDDED